MKTCDECLYWEHIDGSCCCSESANYLKEVGVWKDACPEFRPDEVFPPDEEIEQEEEHEDDA